MKRLTRLWPGVLVLVVVIGYVLWAVFRPLALLKVPGGPLISLKLNTGTSSLAWPNYQAAVGIAGKSNILETYGQQNPLPTASTAKMITALMVLKQKPLSPGEQGPTITLSASDAAIYRAYLAEQGSVVPVTAGEQLSEYQMLEGMLLPSANNFADSLAIWAYGSLAAYTSAANAYVKQLGLTGTAVGTDASGFLPSTKSTAHDLVEVGEMVMENPVLSQIVGEHSASGFPLEDTIRNVNYLLGSDGIIGVKTGNSDQAGGVYVAAAKVNVKQKPEIIVTALMDAPNLSTSMQASLPLIVSAENNFKPQTVVQKGQVVGEYKLPWGGSAPVEAASNITMTTWNGSSLIEKFSLPAITLKSKGNTPVANLALTNPVTASKHNLALLLKTTPKMPSLAWRLMHPLPKNL